MKNILSTILKKPIGIFSMAVVVVFVAFSLFAYLLIPDKAQYANTMHLSIQTKPPGFQCMVINLPPPNVKNNSFLKRAFLGKETIGSEIPIIKYKFTKDSLFFLPFEYAFDTLGYEKGVSKRLFKYHDDEEIKKKHISKKTFYLGTDKYGRDILSRLILGARVSLSIGFIAVLISLMVGVFLGSIAGYYGGMINTFIMWIINISWSIPSLLLVIALSLALGKGFYQVFIAIGLSMWVDVARIVRGQVLSIKEKQFVTAARVLGFSDFRIILKHILPNIISPLIIISAANFATAILMESGLSFLGLGVQPPIPSWGTMIKDHYSYIVVGKAFLALIPGLAIMLLVMSLMSIGNLLRESLSD